MTLSDNLPNLELFYVVARTGWTLNEDVIFPK